MNNDEKNSSSLREFSRRNFLGGVAGLSAIATAGFPPLAMAYNKNDLWSVGSEVVRKRDQDLKLIGLEEHFATEEILKRNNLSYPPGFPRYSIFDVDKERISEMDKANMQKQVLSVQAPGAQNFSGKEGIEFAKKINNYLAQEVIPKHPTRYHAFANVCLAEPEAAADELERCIRELKFDGCMTYGSINGLYLDDERFAPFLARAEKLNCPIYIHPGWATPKAIDTFYKMDDDWFTYLLANAGYGWHQETLVQSLRMIASGTFDRHPNLKIILGHMGEGLPFYYWRFDDIIESASKGKLAMPFQKYIDKHFWITPSAFFRTELLELALSVFSEDKLLYATDYPFVSLSDAADWFRGVDLPRATKEKIAYKNWEQLVSGINR